MLPWGTLKAFLGTVKPESALAAELEPDIAEWSTRLKTNRILADIWDALAALCAIVAAKGTGKKPQSIPDYPRPWRQKEKAFKTVMTVDSWLKLLEGGEKDG